LLADVRQDPDYNPDIPSLVSMMVLPLILQQRLVGMIALETQQANLFTPELFAFMQILVDRIAVALENARLHDHVSNELKDKNRLYDKVSRLERLKTDMIRVATHDLKAPVNIFAGYLELLIADQDRFAPEYHDFFEAMRKAVQRMNNIIKDILSLERIEQRAEGSYTPFDLNACLTQIISEYQAQALRQRQTLHWEHPATPLIVYGDEPQLDEAIRNLVGNALKYTPPQGVIVAHLTEENGQLRFTVVDNGYGIPEDRQQRLFEPFYRAKSPGTEDIEGTGLGLYLVRNVIERHAGKMIFQSVFGQGSTFGFTLPVFSQTVLARRTEQWERVQPVPEN
jgi:signal transduction histidine kinase